jgi:predicted PolB exonuclease-like 3'-5' exonuclease
MLVKNICVFDIETVIDAQMAKTFLDLPQSTADDEAVQELEKYHLSITDGKNAFARQLFHKVVAIAFLQAEVNRDGVYESYKLVDLRAGGKEDFTEADLIKSFFNHLGGLKPRLVTFNGRAFDLPVLKYRAMRYGISARWLYKEGDKWNNYQSRYSSDLHCDLLEVLSDYGASARIKLEEVCALLGIPGKMDVNGSLVSELYKSGKIKEIRDYCELDVANTYLIYLNYMRHTGNITSSSYEEAVQDLHEFLSTNSTIKGHYGDFIDVWSSKIAA